MSHIVCVWELGSDLGHITRFLPVALGLREQGHRITFIIKDLSRVETILGQHGFSVLQAPVWLLKARGLKGPPGNYAEMLVHCGYWDETGLAGLIRAWDDLFKLLLPDLVLFDHAPGALLAARGHGFKKGLYGTGFYHPPATVPTPDFRPQSKIPPQRLLTSETRVVQTINAALDRLAKPKIEQLHQLFSVDEDFLCTLSELDHYPQRKQAKYWGIVQNREKGIKPVWPEGEGKKIFAYLKLEYSAFATILSVLHESSHRILVFSPTIPNAIIEKYHSDKLIFSRDGFKMSEVTKSCNFGICHAGHGTLASLLLGGKPVLTFPTQLEQTLLARNVESIGVGITGLESDTEVQLGEKLTQLCTEQRYTDNARKLADKYSNVRPERVSDAIVARCNELLA